MTTANSSSMELFNALLAGADEDTGPTCLITGEPLGDNSVCLPCGHTFSYAALLKEVKLMRMPSARPYSRSRVPYTGIQCPYCRSIAPGLLPYVPTEEPKRMRGVNTPQSSCLTVHTCSCLIKTGTRKGCACGRAGFMVGGVALCARHWQEGVAKGALDAQWTPDHDAVASANTCTVLRAWLKEKGLAPGGSKRQLVARILAAEGGETHFLNHTPVYGG